MCSFKSSSSEPEEGSVFFRGLCLRMETMAAEGQENLDGSSDLMLNYYSTVKNMD